MNNRIFNIMAALNVIVFIANIFLSIQASNYTALAGWSCALIWVAMWALHRDGKIYKIKEIK